LHRHSEDWAAKIPTPDGNVVAAVICLARPAPNGARRTA
jgi:hypothetical protein